SDWRRQDLHLDNRRGDPYPYRRDRCRSDLVRLQGPADASEPILYRGVFMKTVSDVLKMIKDKDVKFVDLRFTDTKGKMQHVTAVDEAMFEGYAFDGSSIAGWKGIESSDMYLKPDPSSAHVDPFFAQTTVAIFCDVIEPLTGQPYERDPRSIAKKAEAYMASLGIGDK